MFRPISPTWALPGERFFNAASCFYGWHAWPDKAFKWSRSLLLAWWKNRHQTVKISAPKIHHFFSACAPLCCKNMCCASRFCTGGEGAAGSKSKQMSKGPWSKMLVQGHNLRLRDETGGRGRSSTQDKKTRTVSTCWINPGGLALIFTVSFSPFTSSWIREGRMIRDRPLLTFFKGRRIAEKFWVPGVDLRTPFPLTAFKNARNPKFVQNLSQRLFWGVPVRGTEIWKKFVKIWKTVIFGQILTNFFQISVPLTGTPQNNRWDKFWTNLGFRASPENCRRITEKFRGPE